MRRILLSAIIVIACAMQVQAQDVIYLTSGDEIKAKVSEISETEIKYHLWDNQDGPIRSMTRGSVFMIIYQDGQKELFNTVRVVDNSSQAQQSYNETTPKAKYSSTVVTPQKGDYVVTKAADWHGEYLPKIAYGKVYDPVKDKRRRRYYGDGIVFREKEFVKFLELYCGQAREYYRKGSAFGISACIVVWIAIIPAIPLMIVSGNYYGKVLPTYNSNCAGTPVNAMGSVGYIELIEANEDTDCIK